MSGGANLVASIAGRVVSFALFAFTSAVGVFYALTAFFMWPIVYPAIRHVGPSLFVIVSTGVVSAAVYLLKTGRADRRVKMAVLLGLTLLQCAAISERYFQFLG